MVQTATFAVLTAIAFGAVSVAAIPVFPEGVPQSAQRPMQMTAGRRPASFGPGPQRLENQPRPVGAGAQRPENPTRPERGGRPADNMLKSQTQSLDKTKATDARLDRQKAQGFETKFKADHAEYQAYEHQADSLEPSRRPQSKVAPRALPIKQSTPPPARPAVAAPRPNTPPRPATNGAARLNTKPSEQQQLASQRTAIQGEKQKFANQDMAEYKKYQSEANSYHAEAERLEPSQRKPAQAKPQSYQQDIASQNSGLQNMENKFKQEDKQSGAPGPRDLEDEADFYARLDEEEQYAREWDEYDLRAEASADMAEGAEAPAPAPKEHHHKKKGGKKGGKKGKMAQRDFEDDVEEFAREWDEYEIRAEPNVPAPTSDMAEASQAPAAPVEDTSAAPVAPPAPQEHNHHGKKSGKKGKKNHGKSHSQKMASRDLEDEAEAFAREWEEFVTREWAALEELD